MKKIFTILALTLAVNLAFGQDVQSVIDRYHAATGSKNIVADLQTKTWKLDMGMDMVFVKLELKLSVKDSSLYRVDIQIDKQKDYIIVDNGVGYVKMGDEVKTINDKKEIERASMAREVMSLLTLNLDKFDITYAGKDGIYELLEFKAKSPDDKNGAGKYGFNTKTGLLDYVQNVVSVDDMEVESRAEYRNYKQFGAYTLPTFIGTPDKGASMGVSLNKFEVGCDLDDKLFEKPTK